MTSELDEELKQIARTWLNAPFLEKYRLIGKNKLDELANASCDTATR